MYREVFLLVVVVVVVIVVVLCVFSFQLSEYVLRGGAQTSIDFTGRRA